MKYLKKFEKFQGMDYGQEVETRPVVKPDVKPGVAPGRPSPIRRDKPSVDPKPKATAEDVVERFVSILNDRGEDIKKYLEK